MKNKLTAIVFGITLAIISRISLSNLELVKTHAKTNVSLKTANLSTSKTLMAQKTNLLKQNSCPRHPFEEQVFQQIHQIRQQYGLGLLRWNCRLITAAQNHSQDMARTRRMSHTGSNGSQLTDRVKRFGYSYSYIAENVAAGQQTPQEVVNSWMNSQGHRRNILSPRVTEMGVGYSYVLGDRYGTYWTQVFGNR